jgi:hypothetical protein
MTNMVRRRRVPKSPMWTGPFPPVASRASIPRHSNGPMAKNPESDWAVTWMDKDDPSVYLSQTLILEYSCAALLAFIFLQPISLAGIACPTSPPEHDWGPRSPTYSALSEGGLAASEVLDTMAASIARYHSAQTEGSQRRPVGRLASIFHDHRAAPLQRLWAYDGDIRATSRGRSGPTASRNGSACEQAGRCQDQAGLYAVDQSNLIAVFALSTSSATPVLDFGSDTPAVVMTRLAL